jgi:hypothetical protein
VVFEYIKIKVWKESSEKNWEVIFEDIILILIAFSPWEYGLILAAGTATGYLHLFTHISIGDS